MRSLDRAFKSRLNGTGLKPLVQYIKDLFNNNEQGVWYDPSDLSTLYQDAAGTIPVTAVEQPVGLMLDKSKGSIQIDVTTLSTWAGPAIGGAAFNTQNVGLVKTVGTYYILSAEVSEYSGTGTVGFVGIDFGGSSVPSRSNNGLIFAIMQASSAVETRVFTRSTNTCKFTNISVRELPGWHASQTTATSRPVLSARVNLLTKTEDFADAVWVKTNASVSGDLVIPNTTSAAHSVAQGATLAASNKCRIEAKAAGYSWIALWSNSTQTGAYFNVETGAVGNTGTGVNAEIRQLGDGWFECVVSRTATDLTQYQVFVTQTNGQAIFAGNGISGVRLRKADLRPANTGTNLPDYQRVNTSADYDTVGFPAYLKFDGTDDWLATHSIDFTGTDKMMVSAGMNALGLSSTTIGMVVNHNSTGANSFALQAPGAAGVVQFVSFGTSGGHYPSESSLASPLVAVFTGVSDLAAPASALRRNGVIKQTVTTATGGGTFANQPLFIGSQSGGTQRRFNGHLYGLIIRGAATSDSQIKSVEKYINTKIRAYTT